MPVIEQPEVAGDPACQQLLVRSLAQCHLPLIRLAIPHCDRRDSPARVTNVNLMLLRNRITAEVRARLAARGVEIHRSASGVRRTLPAVLAHYRRLGLAPATVMDVGVGAGTPELY